MSIFFKNLSLVTLLLISNGVYAQESSIPLFPDEDEEIYDEADHYQSSIGQQVPQKSAPVPTNPPPVSKDSPRIGRDAPMPTKIILTPPPLPEIGFDLTPDEPEVMPPPKEPDAPIHLPSPQLSEESDSVEPSPSGEVEVLNPQDARDFELEGFGLGMTVMEVGKLALAKGYKIEKSKKEFPLFLTTRYEQECRLSGLYFPEEIRACMRQKGKENKTVFIKSMLITKPGTRESYLFEFTSPGTDNLVWRITYTNLGDNSLNFNTVNANKKAARQKVFFDAVYDTFGYPDDPKNFIWGKKDEAFMQVSMYGTAYNAKITLTDVELSDSDYFDARETFDDMKPIEQFDFAL